MAATLGGLGIWWLADGLLLVGKEVSIHWRTSRRSAMRSAAVGKQSRTAKLPRWVPSVFSRRHDQQVPRPKQLSDAVSLVELSSDGSGAV